MITYEIDESLSLARVAMSGVLDDEEAVRWFEGFRDAIRERRRLGGLIDTRGLERLDVTSPGVQRLAQIAVDADAAMAGSRWAIVTSLDVVFGMARMYSILREDAPYEIAVFRSMDEAAAWLGVDE